MDIKDIKAVYKFLKNTDVVEIEIEDTRGKLKLKRGVSFGEDMAVPASAARGASRSKSKSASGGTGGGKDEGAAEVKSETLSDKVKVVTSPMVGTFYRAPSPDMPFFVEIGTVIKAGQVVCIIEAMKLMNEIESDFAGKIVSILVENGQPVEYGEPLFHVEA
jgi:acetyl-CoA carboxylase biotin carboxyl carrier protein